MLKTVLWVALLSAGMLLLGCQGLTNDSEQNIRKVQPSVGL